MASVSQPSAGPRRRWPLFVGLGVGLGVLLAFVWMRHEVERTRFRTQGFPEAGITRTNFPAD